jgi:hypothetical protein
VGRRGAATPGYRLDQIVSGLHDGRIKALYLIGENPAQTEPNATTSRRASRLRVHRLAGHLPERLDRKYATSCCRRRASRRRTARSRTPSGA